MGINKMIKLSSILNENIINDFMNNSSDSPNQSMIKLTLVRNGWDSYNTAWYRLEDDGWFRRYSKGPDTKDGIMIRDIKIDKEPTLSKWGMTLFRLKLRALPNEFISTDDDIKSNWITHYGYIVIDEKNVNDFMNSIGIDGLEKFINSNVTNYIP